MAPATKPAPLFEFDLIVRARDIADERLALCDSESDVKWWSRLRDVCEGMLAGELPESELASWLDEYEIGNEVMR